MSLARVAIKVHDTSVNQTHVQGGAHTHVSATICVCMQHTGMLVLLAGTQPNEAE